MQRLDDEKGQSLVENPAPGKMPRFAKQSVSQRET
jgi:hypothetical protein